MGLLVFTSIVLWVNITHVISPVIDLNNHVMQSILSCPLTRPGIRAWQRVHVGHAYANGI